MIRPLVIALGIGVLLGTAAVEAGPIVVPDAPVKTSQSPDVKRICTPRNVRCTKNEDCCSKSCYVAGGSGGTGYCT